MVVGHYFDGERDHIGAILRLRPNARRGALKKFLYSHFRPTVDEIIEDTYHDGPDRYCGVEAWYDEFRTYWDRFDRIPDAWEVIGNRIILYEVDGTHPTTLIKFRDMSILADAIHGMCDYRGSSVSVELWLYDVRSDVTHYFEPCVLDSQWITAESLMEQYGPDVSLSPRLPRTDKVFGFNLSLLEN